MSPIGTKLPFPDVRAMVAIEGKADVRRAALNGRIAALSGANVKAHLQMLVLRLVGQDLTSEAITCTFQLVLDPYPLPGLSRPQKRRPNMRDPACQDGNACNPFWS